MKSRILVCVLCLAGGSWIASYAAAQAEKSSLLILSPSSRGTGQLKILQQKNVEIIKGAPYTATRTKEVSHVLADGNRVVDGTTTFVARDSEGRTLNAGLGEGKSLSAAKWKTISDPVAQSTYMYVAPSTPSGKHIAAQFSGAKEAEFAPAEDVANAAPNLPGEVKRESLGRQMMQGLWVEGSRVTRTIAAGTAGNKQAFDITSEEWYSPGLHVVVLKKQNDPRVGETVVRLTDIKLAEPDSSLFQVPADDQNRLNELATHTSHSD
jgi:hypothetical protein